MNNNVNFIAIDFETATGYRHSICEAGICIVKHGIVKETKSWYVRPENNYFSDWTIEIHGIHPGDTEDAEEFPQVWEHIMEYLVGTPILVSHNNAFDMTCIRVSLDYYGLTKPEIDCYCSLRAARMLYSIEGGCSLGNLCSTFGIPEGTHHRAGDDAEMCARLFLKEMSDSGADRLEQMTWCREQL